MTNTVVAVVCAHAHDIVLEALAQVTVVHATACELKPVEVDGIGGMFLKGSVLEYDPVSVLNVPFTNLLDYVLCLFVQYHLNKMPLCNLMPDIRPTKKKHLH